MKKNCEGGGRCHAVTCWGDNHDSLHVMFLIIAMHKKCPHSELYSGPYFPAFRLNTEKYGISLHIQSKLGKYGPEKLRIQTLFTQREIHKKNLFKLKNQENKSTMRQSLCKKSLNMEFFSDPFSPCTDWIQGFSLWVSVFRPSKVTYWWDKTRDLHTFLVMNVTVVVDHFIVLFICYLSMLTLTNIFERSFIFWL